MAQNSLDKKGSLINELDSLRYALNSGPEFQQDIPTFNEPHPKSNSSPHSAPLEQCDLFRDSDGIIHDPDLDVPILTDAYEEHEPWIKPVHAENNSEETNSSEQLTAPEFTETETSQHETSQHEILDPEPQAPTPIDVEQLSDETDSSVMELEQVLDELVAEQLPKLEQQLRQKLRKELEADIETNDLETHDLETNTAGENIELTALAPKEY